MPESETEEWKEDWKKDYLNTISAFASKNGGVMIIGKKDNGTIVDVSNTKKLMKSIPDTVRNVLGFSPSVEEHIEDGKKIIKIIVEPQGDDIEFDGHYYKRSGSTTVRITGVEHRNILLKKEGKTWTDVNTDDIRIGKLSQEAIDYFVKKGTESGRMSLDAKDNDTERLLDYYKLMDENGLRRSAALLFADRPSMMFPSAAVMIGVFDNNDNMLRHDLIDCPVIMQPDAAMKVLLDKYIQGVDEVEGLAMVRKYPYPERALREAIMNAITHRDYSSVIKTYVYVYPDRVEISNPGKLPEGWTADDLFKKHRSIPANPNIAKAFYDMKFIENWGGGISRIQNECKAAGNPMPEYTVNNEGIEVTFRPAQTPQITSYGLPTGITLKEMSILKLMDKNNSISITEIAEQLGVNPKTVQRAIGSLTEKGIVKRVGPARGGSWAISWIKE